MPRAIPSSEDLRRGVSIVYHETGSLFTWYAWWIHFRPRIEADGHIGAASFYYSFQQNSALLASIMAVRKLTEFFKSRPQNDERDDDLRAYDYPGFTSLGDVLDRADISEIHKRVAHMTYREVQAGPASYELKIAVTDLVVPRCLLFFEYLERTFYVHDEAARSDVDRVRHGIVTMNENWKMLSTLLEQ